jgi:hypothetical protein
MCDTSAGERRLLAEHSRRLAAAQKREIQNSPIDFIMQTELRRLIELREKAEQQQAAAGRRLHSDAPNCCGCGR